MMVMKRAAGTLLSDSMRMSMKTFSAGSLSWPAIDFITLSTKRSLISCTVGFFGADALAATIRTMAAAIFITTDTNFGPPVASKEVEEDGGTTMRRLLIPAAIFALALPAFAGHNRYGHHGLSVTMADEEGTITDCGQIRVTYEDRDVPMVSEDLAVGSLRSLK